MLRKLLTCALALVAVLVFAGGALAQAPEKKKITIAVGGKISSTTCR